MGRSQAVPRGRDSRFGPDADDTGCRFLHVDMDAFFASVEIRRRPELRGRPVVVAGAGPRGVVTSASYPAREYGVRSAMPAARARALCPHAVVLPPDFAAYRAASAAVMRLFRDVTPLVEPLSLDEAFLDVEGARRRLGGPARIAADLRRRVAGRLGLTCSVGVASTMVVAKLASTRAKPDGLMVVPAASVREFLHPLPVAALWGVGERTAEALHRLGLRTIGDLAHAPVGMLRAAVGAATAAHLHDLSWGRDPREVNPDGAEKSVGAETTFDVDVADPAEVRKALLALAGTVAARVRAAGQVGRTVAVKVRFADFRTVTRSRTLGTTTDVAHDLFDTAWRLFAALPVTDRIRLVGIRLEGLSAASEAPLQPVLGAPEHGWREAEVAAAAVAARFGPAAVRPASLLEPGAGRPARTRAGRNRDSSWDVPLSDRPLPS